MNPFEDENATYRVIVNDKGQYSLWPFGRDVPLGWVVVVESASRPDCLKYVEENWTDMRPKSVSAAVIH